MTDSGGSSLQALERYPSLAAFYNADPHSLGMTMASPLCGAS